MQTLYRVFVFSLLCLLAEPYPVSAGTENLPQEPGAAASPSGASKNVTATEQARALHVLNRLSFGPRPGEVEAVAAMGVDRWIALQLHPEKLNDSALQQRLAEYQAPFMDPATLMEKFPPGTLIRQAINGRISPPSDASEHAVWESQMAIVKQRMERKSQTGKPDAALPGSLPSMAAANTNLSPVATGETNPSPVSSEEMARSTERVTSAPARTSYANVEMAGLIDLAPEERYGRLLALPPGRIQSAVRSLTPQQRPLLLAGMSPAQRETVLSLLNPRLVVVNETESVRILQDIYSTRQLQRVMTEFWLNHFNVFVRKNEVEPYYLPQFQQQVITPHALGKFEDLLDAVAQSPAMLLYLDNQQSVGPDSPFALRRDHPNPARLQRLLNLPSAAPAIGTKQRKRSLDGINENYGRELMELHTVGVNAGYTQQDVIEAAKVLTGWTVAPPIQGGGFRFAENRHEPGDKIVMGHKIKQGGEREGLTLLHLLATSPSTAHFLSQQLAVRFVGDNPSPALVDRMAKTFLSSDGDISKVLETMFHSSEFWSPSNSGSKIKTPLDYVVSAVRATDAEVTQPYRLVAELKVMGMPLSGTQEPNGYSMTNDAWSSSSELVNRMNFALALATNQIPGVTVSYDQLLAPEDAGWTLVEQESRLEQLLLHQPVSAQMHRALLAALSDTTVQSRAASIRLTGDNGGNPFVPRLQHSEFPSGTLQDAVITGLLLGSPSFQTR